MNKILDEIDGVKMEEIENKDYISKNVRVKANLGKLERRRSDSQNLSRSNLSRDTSEGDESNKEDGNPKLRI